MIPFIDFGPSDYIARVRDVYGFEVTKTRVFNNLRQELMPNLNTMYVDQNYPYLVLPTDNERFWSVNPQFSPGNSQSCSGWTSNSFGAYGSWGLYYDINQSIRANYGTTCNENNGGGGSAYICMVEVLEVYGVVEWPQ